MAGVFKDHIPSAPAPRTAITVQLDQLDQLAQELANRVNNFECFVEGQPSAAGNDAGGATVKPPSSLSDRLETINATLRRGLASIERISAAF